MRRISVHAAAPAVFLLLSLFWQPEATAAGKPADAGTAGAGTVRDESVEAIFELDVAAPICGVYRDGKWHRPLDSEESGRPEAIARARSEGEEYLRREALKSALARLGFSLYAQDRFPSCSVPYGLEIRTAQRSNDTLDFLMERLSFPRLLEVLAQETVTRNRDLLLYRRIKIRLDVLKEQLDSEGYSVAKSSLRIRFVRGTHLDERAFLETIRSGYPYLSHLEQSRSRGKPEYVLLSHAPVDKAVEKLKGMDAGLVKFSVDLLPGGIAEVALWR